MLFEIKEKFKLSDKFIEKYQGKQPEWGPLGYITYKRSYAREIVNYDSKEYDYPNFAKKFDSWQTLIEKNQAKVRTEEYWETVRRVVEGCYTTQLNHCRNLKLPWNAYKAQKSAQKMYELMWEFKFLPPGRGLWAMGADVVWERGSACLNNCGFTSTNQLDTSFSEPFTFLMDMSLMGVGVAFDTLGSGKVDIKEPKKGDYVHTVEDSREGWVETVQIVLDSYVGKDVLPREIDYSEIRPEGSPIITFGGVAPGSAPLEKCVEELCMVLDKHVGKKVDSSLIVDIFNICGKCVVSGGIRRVAELALGKYNDEDYMKLKDPNLYSKELKEWRWASNNSVSCNIGMNYDELAKQTTSNGEPGYFWLENARKYGRLKDGETWVDDLVMGTNPCGEQSLESGGGGAGELCNLVETFPSKHKSYDDFKLTLKFAYLYAKTVTLIPTHNEKTNQILLRNRRIGLSQTGIVEAFEKFGKRNFVDICDKSYSYLKALDKKYARWLCVPESIKITTVKPSGSISLLPGVTPGIHFPHSKYYIRRIELTRSSPLVKLCKDAGYNAVDSIYKDNTIIVEFPVESKNYSRSKTDVSMWEQLEMAALMQTYWSDNQVSITVTFNKDEAKDIKHALELFEDRLKAVSFLPLSDHKYEQAPYEEIDEETFKMLKSKTKKFKFDNALDTHDVNAVDKFCDGDSCVLK